MALSGYSSVHGTFAPIPGSDDVTQKRLRWNRSLFASERHSYILLEAERQRLYDGNAALKARVEELEQIMVLHFITHDDDHQPEGEQGEQKAQDFRDECGRIIHRQAADARKEQEASNDK